MILKQRAHGAFVADLSNAKPGHSASPHTLPPELRRLYTAELILGKGAFGCVVKAKRNDLDQCVAIKVMLPEKGAFEGKENRRLKREAEMHQLFMSKKC